MNIAMRNLLFMRKFLFKLTQKCDLKNFQQQLSLYLKKQKKYHIYMLLSEKQKSVKKIEKTFFKINIDFSFLNLVKNSFLPTQLLILTN